MRIKKELYRGFGLFLLTYITLTRILVILGHEKYSMPVFLWFIMVLLLILCLIRFVTLEEHERYNRYLDSEKVSQELYKDILRGDSDGGKGPNSF